MNLLKQKLGHVPSNCIHQRFFKKFAPSLEIPGRHQARGSQNWHRRRPQTSCLFEVQDVESPNRHLRWLWRIVRPCWHFPTFWSWRWSHSQPLGSLSSAGMERSALQATTRLQAILLKQFFPSQSRVCLSSPWTWGS